MENNVTEISESVFEKVKREMGPVVKQYEDRIALLENEIRMLRERCDADDVRKRNAQEGTVSKKIKIEYDALWPQKIGDIVYRLHPLHPEFNCIKHMGWLYYVN